MDVLDTTQDYETIRVMFKRPVCFLKIFRPEERNTINNQLVNDLETALATYGPSANVVVLEGLPDVFCGGADFSEISQSNQALESSGTELQSCADSLYSLWLQLRFGHFVSVALVRGQANAGGIGFAAVCDLVLCDESASFSLSEMLFGLMPACVLPFLIRRVGFAKANYMTLTTHSISARTALQWGLVDACEPNGKELLRKHLIRLRFLSKDSIVRYKEYLRDLDNLLVANRGPAVSANREVFCDANNLKGIRRYMDTGRFPWEGSD